MKLFELIIYLLDRLNDLWMYDGTNWIWISGNNIINQKGIYGTKGIASSSNIPGARYSSISWIDSNNNLWLFGGIGFATSGSYGMKITNYEII